jgi:hypothetical protein
MSSGDRMNGKKYTIEERVSFIEGEMKILIALNVGIIVMLIANLIEGRFV